MARPKKSFPATFDATPGAMRVDSGASLRERPAFINGVNSHTSEYPYTAWLLQVCHTFFNAAASLLTVLSNTAQHEEEVPWVVDSSLVWA